QTPSRRRKGGSTPSTCRTRTGGRRGRGSCAFFCPLLAPFELGVAWRPRYERSGRNLAGGFVGRRNHARVRNEMVDELKPARRLRAVEDALAAPKQHREGHQDQPVDQPGCQQGHIERTASLDEQVAAL